MKKVPFLLIITFLSMTGTILFADLTVTIESKYKPGYTVPETECQLSCIGDYRILLFAPARNFYTVSKDVFTGDSVKLYIVSTDGLPLTALRISGIIIFQTVYRATTIKGKKGDK